MQLRLVVEITGELGAILAEQRCALGRGGVPRRHGFLQRRNTLLETLDEGKQLLFGDTRRATLGILALVQRLRDAITDDAEQGQIFFEQRGINKGHRLQDGQNGGRVGEGRAGVL